LDLSVFWQPVSGILAALACYSRLVDSGQCDIISSVMSMSPNQITAANAGKLLGVCREVAGWLESSARRG